MENILEEEWENVKLTPAGKQMEEMIKDSHDVNKIWETYFRALHALYRRAYQRCLAAKEGIEQVIDPEEREKECRKKLRTMSEN